MYIKMTENIFQLFIKKNITKDILCNNVCILDLKNFHGYVYVRIGSH